MGGAAFQQVTWLTVLEKKVKKTIAFWVWFCGYVVEPWMSNYPKTWVFTIVA